MTDTLNKWDVRFMRIALLEVANWSKDPAKKVGCVIVSPDKTLWTSGYNGFPWGIADTPERLCDTELKNRLMRHAERNAINNAKWDLRGWTLYVTQAPCEDCALEIVNAGIVRVVRPPIDAGSKWAEGQLAGTRWLLEAHVRVNVMKSVVTGKISVL